MPLGFTGGRLAPQIERFGDDAAQMILQTGATIQQGLHQMMTNRQVAGLGQELGTLNPESPEWAQQAVQLGSRYPLAMKSPAGQFMLSTQAKAHAQWQQTQQATARAQTQFGNSVALEGMKQRNRIALADRKPSGEVDLSGMALPSRLTPQNPASGINLQGPTPSGEPLGAADAGTAALTSGTGAGMEAQPPLPLDQLDPLAVSALRPLAETQRLTGTKPTKSQVFGALSAERTRAQQMKMQDDRQLASENAAEKRDITRAKSDEVKALQAEARQQRLILQGQINTIERDITQHRAALNKHLASRQKVLASGDETALKEFDAQRAELEGVLQQAGADRTKLLEQINSIGKEGGGELTLPVAAERPVKKYDPATGTFK